MKKIPQIVRNYYSQLVWSFPTSEKIVYLTFDDGPTPEVSDWVLDVLDTFDARATFFLLGKNVEKHPEIAHRMIDSGHSIGNHGYWHIDGWKTSLRAYLRDFLKAQQSIYEYTGKYARLFRPAYAHITQTKARYINRSHQIIMMDVISGDFDEKLSWENVVEAVMSHVRPGSVIVFHDSEKAFPRLKKALPEILDRLQVAGYDFEAIPTRLKAMPG